MAQTPSRGRVVGDYLVGRQIGSGSFSVVWHARHRVHGTEVAIKEIVTGRLNKKLQESLMSEIFILKKINHPNIIRLHDIIEVRNIYSMNYLYFLATLFIYLFVSVAVMIVGGGGYDLILFFIVDKLEGKIRKEIWKSCFWLCPFLKKQRGKIDKNSTRLQFAISQKFKTRSCFVFSLQKEYNIL